MPEQNVEIEEVKFNSGKRLRDLDSRGKERPWRTNKIENLEYAELLEVLKFKKANNVHNCAERLTYSIDKNGELKLYQVWFCRSRLCPMCNWRRSIKMHYQLNRLLTIAIKRKPDAQFLFLTLTVKNVFGKENLKSALKSLTASFHKLSKYKKVQKNVIGYIRSTEITVNDVDGSYHPHLHVLLMIDPNYFCGSSNYIDQKEWTRLWQKAAKLDYVPLVNIEKIYDKKGKGSINSAVYETTKYQTKSKDYLDDDLEDDQKKQRVSDLEYALRGTRQFGFGGLLKTISAELKIDENDDDLIHVDEENEKTKSVVRCCTAIFDYSKFNYYWK